MDGFLKVCAEALLLVAALSVDAFVASLAYGAAKIKMPLPSVCVVSGVSTGVLLLSLLCGRALGPVIPARLTAVLCFAILLCLGMVKLLDACLKLWIKSQSQKEIHFSLFRLKFILNIYADPARADEDHSKSLSPREAVSLALALSLDGLAAGFGAGLAAVPALPAALCSFTVGAAAVLCGRALGVRIARRSGVELSWLSGLLLIVLAFVKFLQG